MPRRLPILAVILGIAGIIPFVLTGLGAVASNNVASAPAVELLIGYGAVVLSFLGGVHWGFTLAVDPDPAERPRLVLGVLPGLLGWAALGLGLYAALPALAIGLMIVLFIATAAVEWKFHQRGWVPGGYIGMRVAITVVVVAILVTVLVLRLIGGHLIF